MDLFLLSARSIRLSLGAFSKTWIRCASTDPASVRPPGPTRSWSREETNAWKRWRYANEPNFRERMKQYQKTPDNLLARSKRHKERYAKDAKYRQHTLERNAKRYTVAGYREAVAQKLRERYQNDPEYRNVKLKSASSWFADPKNRKAKAQRHKWRYDNDPEYRERLQQNARERYWKQKFGLSTARADRHNAQDESAIPDKSERSDTKP